MNVFGCFRNRLSVLDWQIADGRLFQMDGPETAKLCDPYFDVLVRVVQSGHCDCDAERRHWHR